MIKTECETGKVCTDFDRDFNNGCINSVFDKCWTDRPCPDGWVSSARNGSCSGVQCQCCVRDWETAPLLSGDEIVVNGMNAYQHYKNNRRIPIKDVFKRDCCLGQTNSHVLRQSFDRNKFCSDKWCIYNKDDTCDDAVKDYCLITDNYGDENTGCHEYCNASGTDGVMRRKKDGHWCVDAIKNYCVIGDNMLDSKICLSSYGNRGEGMDSITQDWADRNMTNLCKRKDKNAIDLPVCRCLLSNVPIKKCVDSSCSDSESYLDKSTQDRSECDNLCVQQIIANYNKNVNIHDIKFNQECVHYNYTKKTYYSLDENGNCVEKDGGEFVNDSTCGGHGSVKKYSCINGKCVEKNDGEYVSSDCDNKCVVKKYSCAGDKCIEINGGDYDNDKCDNKCKTSSPNSQSFFIQNKNAIIISIIILFCVILIIKILKRR